MCATINKFVAKPTMRVVTVYKAVDPIGTTKTRWEPWSLVGKFDRGKWVRAKDPKYGFNCFAKKTSAKRLGTRIIKCRVRLVEGYGTYYGAKVVLPMKFLYRKDAKNGKNK